MRVSELEVGMQLVWVGRMDWHALAVPVPKVRSPARRELVAQIPHGAPPALVPRSRRYSAAASACCTDSRHWPAAARMDRTTAYGPDAPRASLACSSPHHLAVSRASRTHLRARTETTTAEYGVAKHCDGTRDHHIPKAAYDGDGCTGPLGLPLPLYHAGSLGSRSPRRHTGPLKSGGPLGEKRKWMGIGVWNHCHRTDRKSLLSTCQLTTCGPR